MAKMRDSYTYCVWVLAYEEPLISTLVQSRHHYHYHPIIVITAMKFYVNVCRPIGLVQCT